MKPYTNIIESGDRIVRKFDQNIDPEELMWHRDERDREVTIIGETDWLFQLDNELPQPMKGTIKIPKEVYHRTIKGTGDLVISILES